MSRRAWGWIGIGLLLAAGIPCWLHRPDDPARPAPETADEPAGEGTAPGLRGAAARTMQPAATGDEARPASPPPATPATAPGATVIVKNELGGVVMPCVLASDDGTWKMDNPFVAPDGIPRALPAEVTASTLVVTAVGFQPARVAQPRGAVVVVLRGALSIRGVVHDADGEPVAGARVGIDVPRGPVATEQNPAWHTETAADGTFELTRLWPGVWQVRAQRARAQEGSQHVVTRQVALPVSGEVALHLGRTADIRGRITGPRGERPPPRVQVALRGTRPDGSYGRVWHATAAADGQFVLEDVDTGSNTFWAWTQDRDAPIALTIRRDLRPGTHDLVIALEAGAAIQGTFVDARGDAVKGGGWLYAYEGDVLINSTSFDGDGTFQTHALPVGRTYDITYIAANGWSGTRRGVAAGATGVEVQGRRMPALRGRVVRPDGSPAGGILVTAQAVGARADTQRGIIVQGSTDADGRFALTTLGDLPYLVTAAGGSEHAPARVPGTVRAGADVELRLQPPQVLAGRVLLPSSRPAAGETIWVVPEDRVFHGWRLTLDADGRFRVTNLPAGTVRFVLESLGGMLEVGRAMIPDEDVTLTLPRR